MLLLLLWLLRVLGLRLGVGLVLDGWGRGLSGRLIGYWRRSGGWRGAVLEHADRWGRHGAVLRGFLPVSWLRQRRGTGAEYGSCLGLIHLLLLLVWCTVWLREVRRGLCLDGWGGNLLDLLGLGLPLVVCCAVRLLVLSVGSLRWRFLRWCGPP